MYIVVSKWKVQIHKGKPFKGNLNTEQAIRDAYQRGGDEREKKLTQRVNVWHDPSMRAYPQPQKIINPRGRYFKAHHLEFMPKQEVIRTNTEPIDMEKDFPPWLNFMQPISVEHMTPAEIERVPTIRDLMPKFDPLNTDEYPAVVALLHQEREQRRHAG